MQYFLPHKYQPWLFEKVDISDKSEPSWLEPQLELKDFQLGSARLITFFPSARNRKSAGNEPKFLFLFIFLFDFRLCS